ncbi:MAG: HD domain-containing phosphohydrolase [Terriglobales bacterium]
MSTLSSQSAVVEEITTRHAGSHGSNRGNILIADDDQDYRELYSDLLRSEGFQTFCAKDGAQALAVLHRERIDIALVDGMMPKTNGMTVCRELRNNPETRLVPILLLTSWEAAPGRAMGIEAGTDADAYLRKPVNNIELITRVRTLLEKKRFTDDLEDTEKMLLTFTELVEAKNPYSAGHGLRVSRTAVSLAARMGLSAEDREWVHRGALLHDIGKVGVPDEILNKPGPLNAEERIILNSHTYVGERICAPLASFRPLLQIIRSHHERLDGSGYPDGLQGSQISILTRVVSLADVYDGLTTDRPYHRGYSHRQAILQIRREAKQGWWDPRIVDVLEEWSAPSSLPYVRCTVSEDA